METVDETQDVRTKTLVLYPYPFLVFLGGYSRGHLLNDQEQDESSPQQSASHRMHRLRTVQVRGGHPGTEVISPIGAFQRLEEAHLSGCGPATAFIAFVARP